MAIETNERGQRMGKGARKLEANIRTIPII